MKYSIHVHVHVHVAQEGTLHIILALEEALN